MQSFQGDNRYFIQNLGSKVSAGLIDAWILRASLWMRKKYPRVKFFPRLRLAYPPWIDHNVKELTFIDTRLLNPKTFNLFYDPTISILVIPPSTNNNVLRTRVENRSHKLDMLHYLLYLLGRGDVLFGMIVVPNYDIIMETHFDDINPTNR